MTAQEGHLGDGDESRFHDRRGVTLDQLARRDDRRRPHDQLIRRHRRRRRHRQRRQSRTRDVSC